MRISLTCILFLLSASTFCQDKNKTDVTNVYKVTFLNPGASAEFRIGKYQTLYGRAYLYTSVAEINSFDEKRVDVYFDPAGALQYRYYYNAIKRSKAKKRTELNSLNYLAAVYEVFFSKLPLSASYYKELNRRAISQAGFVWGIQRNYKKRFSLDFNIGLGYLFGKGTTRNLITNEDFRETIGSVTYIAEINLGFWLNRKKKAGGMKVDDQKNL